MAHHVLYQLLAGRNARAEREAGGDAAHDSGAATRHVAARAVATGAVPAGSIPAAGSIPDRGRAVSHGRGAAPQDQPQDDGGADEEEEEPEPGRAVSDADQRQSRDDARRF